jgi:protein gp37
MGDKTTIEWTDANWNPIRGCSRVSEGCRNCYAEGVARRFSGPGLPYEGLVNLTTGAWNGKIRFVEDHLLDPLRWKKPRRIFVNSMSDLFHENVTDEMRDRIFAVMALCPQHTFQVLTKRPERMLKWFTQHFNVKSPGAREMIFEISHKHPDFVEGREWVAKAANAFDVWPLPNVWLGVSVENQKAADERIPLLLQTPAAVRFLSCEPLLGKLSLDRVGPGPWPLFGPLSGYCSKHFPRHHCHCDRQQASIDWVIAGGESGPNARPMHPDWVRSLRDQCADAGVPFFFKQWGEYVTYIDREKDDPDWALDYSKRYADEGRTQWLNLAGGRGFHGERFHVMRRIGKSLAGNLLDGQKHHAFPEVRY